VNNIWACSVLLVIKELAFLLITSNMFAFESHLLTGGSNGDQAQPADPKVYQVLNIGMAITQCTVGLLSGTTAYVIGRFFDYGYGDYMFITSGITAIIAALIIKGIKLDTAKPGPGVCGQRETNEKKKAEDSIASSASNRSKRKRATFRAQAVGTGGARACP